MKNLKKPTLQRQDASKIILFFTKTLNRKNAFRISTSTFMNIQRKYDHFKISNCSSLIVFESSYFVLYVIIVLLIFNEFMDCILDNNALHNSTMSKTTEDDRDSSVMNTTRKKNDYCFVFFFTPEKL